MCGGPLTYGSALVTRIFRGFSSIRGYQDIRDFKGRDYATCDARRRALFLVLHAFELALVVGLKIGLLTRNLLLADEIHQR